MPEVKKETKFNSNVHLVELKHKAKQPDGGYKEVTSMYLPVAWRLVWMREEHPNWAIKTEIITYDRQNRYAVCKTTVEDEKGRVLATAHKQEDAIGFPDFLEKSETGSVGRALAMCGFGTQFSPDLEEGSERIVDAPIITKSPTEGIVEPRATSGITAPQIRAIRAIYAEKHLDDEGMKKVLQAKLGYKSHSEMNIREASDWITYIKNLPSEEEETEKVDVSDFDGEIF